MILKELMGRTEKMISFFGMPNEYWNSMNKLDWDDFTNLGKISGEAVRDELKEIMRVWRNRQPRMI